MPQPALTTGMDALTNVEQLSFHLDREAKSIPVVYFQDQQTKSSIGIPIPDVTPLNPPLGLIPPLPPKIEHLSDTGHLKPAQALMKGLAYVGQHSDAVFGTGTLNVATYGRILKSRQLVGVRGAGLPYDGLYYVRSVTHDIQRGAYKQTFSLARNGLAVHAADGAGMSSGPFHGIYPGKVETNIDPLSMGRIQVSVADVGGSSILSWALPCLPVTGRSMGMFTVPPVGAGVWVTFVRGDTDYPVWMGGYYANGDAPSLSRNVPPGISGITLQTQTATASSSATRPAAAS